MWSQLHGRYAIRNSFSTLKYVLLVDSISIHGLIPKVPYTVTAKLAGGSTFPFKFDGATLTTTTEEAKTPEPVSDGGTQEKPSVKPDVGNPTDEPGGMTTSASSYPSLQQGLLVLGTVLAYISI